MTTLADVVDALQRANCKPTRTGTDAYTAYCPVHEADGHGHKPSLSIARGERVDVVINCHAGCGHAAILKALGIQSTGKAGSARRSAGAGSRRKRHHQGQRMNVNRLTGRHHHQPTKRPVTPMMTRRK